MKRCIRVAWLMLFAWALLACGGGGGGVDAGAGARVGGGGGVGVGVDVDVDVDVDVGGGGGGGVGEQTKSLNKPFTGKPRQTVKVTPYSFALTLSEGGQQDVNLVAEDVAFRSRSASLSLSVAPLDAVFAPDPLVTSLAGGRYSVLLRTAPSLAVGEYNGVVTLRLCRESPCARPIAGTTVTVPYTVRVQGTVTVTPDWQTHQGNAAHTGYVPVTLDPARFAYAWEWRRSTSGVLGFINAVVTEGGRVFVTDDEYFGSLTSLYALNETDGSLAWRQDFINYPALNPPAVANGIVYVATTGHENTFLWAFRANDGTPVFKSAFAGQWPHVLAPTVRDGRVFTNGGYYGGGVYGYDATSGASLWSMFSGDDDMSTPAVDGHHAYHYNGNSLEVYSAATGAAVASITDPQVAVSGYSYHGSPMLGSDDHIMALSGGAFSGRASSSTEQYESRPLTNFSLAARAMRWRSNSTYLTAPAVANGVVYAGRNNPKSLDALDERTGQVLWSWPGTANDTEFHRNVLVTNNLVFVSTDRAIHAVDLNTHQSVWSYPTPGMLALSAGGTLYIAEGARQPTGRLIAIRLR
jgi:outer membrane protein assembly factor BamB